MTQHARFHDAEGTAALGICESLILALIDLKLLSEQEACDVLEDVVATHEQAGEVAQTPNKHRAVVDRVRAMLVGKSEARSTYRVVRPRRR